VDENELPDAEGRDRGRDVREIAAEAVARFRAQFDGFAIPEGDAAEAIPFRFVPPLFAFR
jgi:hypothetical protein